MLSFKVWRGGGALQNFWKFSSSLQNPIFNKFELTRNFKIAQKKLFEIFQINMIKKLDKNLKRTEKESIKNHFLFKSYKGFNPGTFLWWNRKLSGGRIEKCRKRFCLESAFARIRFQKMVRLKEKERLTGGSHPSGFKIQTGKTELIGAQELRRSLAATHGEAGGSDGTSMFRASFRVGW